jgi:uncharacterized protein (DUF1330 family)
MSYYIVFNYDITDPEMFEKYEQATGKSNPADFGITPMVIDYEPNDIEGQSGQRLIILGFESQDAAMAFYNSPEYQAVVDFRKNATKGWVRGAPQFVPPSG